MMEEKKRKRVLGSIVLAALLCLMSVCAVQAAGSKADTGRVVHVGFLDSDGFLYENRDGTYYGYGVEYLERVAEVTGWRYEFIGGSWKELIKKMEAGEIDFLAPVQSDTERRQEMEYGCDSIGREYSLLYVTAENQDVYYDDYGRMEGMKIGVVDGWQQQKILHFTTAKQNIHYEEKQYQTEADVVWALRSGEIDAAMLSSENYSSEFKLVGRWGANPAFFVTSHQNAELMEELNAAVMQILVKDPQFQEVLYEKYYGTAQERIWPEFTREEAEYIQKAQDIPVMLVTDRYVWSAVDRDGAVTGIMPDIIRKIGEISGLHIKFRPADVADSPIEDLEGEEVLLAGNVMCSKDPEKREDRVYTDNYVTGTLAAVGKEGFRKSLKDNLTVAIPQGFKALERIIRQQYPQYTIVGYSSAQTCMRAVKNGEADIMVEDSYVVKQWMQKPVFRSMQVIPRFSEPEGFCFAGVSGRDDVLISILDKSISMLEESFVEESIIQNTIGMPYRPGVDDFLYEYRYPLAVAGGTLALSILYLFLFFQQQNKHTEILRKKNQELEGALTLAEEAGKAKGEFLSRMSHEMRTPLNAIIGFSELTDVHRADAAKVHNYHEKIAIASDLLLRIINDILDMSAIEQKKLKLEQAPVNMEKLLQQIDTVYQEQCKGKGITYLRSGENLEQISLIGDSLRISQVFLNLLSNAVKFTEKGGKIEAAVKAEISDEQNLKLFVSVRDNGIGMSEEMKQRIFQPFEQENGSVARQYGGSGLGLSIVKGLVEAMNGTIQVESKKDQGTAFYLEIPFTYMEAGHKEEEKESEEPCRQNLCGRRFLLAEDNEMNAEIATEFLENLGAEIHWAQNGREAVEMFQRAPAKTYDLILMDIQMPEMDGYMAAKMIRSSKHPQAESIPIIAMTADAFQTDKERARKAGMNAHLAKPIDFRELQQELLEWL